MNLVTVHAQVGMNVCHHSENTMLSFKVHETLSFTV